MLLCSKVQYGRTKFITAVYAKRKFKKKVVNSRPLVSSSPHENELKLLWPRIEDSLKIIPNSLVLFKNDPKVQLFKKL